MKHSEAYWNGYDDGMNDFLAEAYGQREFQFSGYAGDAEEYRKGWRAGWDEAQRIDDEVE